MGTYRQPSQVIDKSLSVSNQGMQNIATQMERGLARRRQQQLLDAKGVERKNELRNKELKIFNAKKNASIDGYKENMASWEHINQGADGQESQGVSIENQLRDNALYYLDIMSGSVEGDERYRNAELSIKNMINEYPLMAEMLNKEAQQASNAYLMDGNQRPSNDPDAFLESNDPLGYTKKNMLRNLKAGTNGLRYNIQTGPNGVNLIYEDSNGKELTINARRYKIEVENGTSLVETTDAKAQKVFMDGVWSIVGGKGYEGEGETQTTYTEFKEKGESLTETDKILHFSKANEKVEQQVRRWVENNQGEVTQSQWQLLGGKGVFDREENKEELKTLLTRAQIDNYGIPGSKLVSSSSVEKNLTSSGGTSPFDQTTKSQLAGLGGVFNEVNTDVNKAFEMPQGDRVKTIKQSINTNLPEKANYAYLDFTQVKTQIEEERKKAVDAGNKEEIVRLDKLKKQYKLDQAPNKDLLYKKTFTKGKIQLDKPFDSSDKDSVLRTIARERGITSEEAFEVFKSQRTSVEEKTFNPQNFKKQPAVDNAQATQTSQSSNTNTGAIGSSTSQGGGSVANTQPIEPPTQGDNEYGNNVKIDPATKVVSFDFNGKTVDASKAASDHPVLKMKNDGNDYKRKIANFETLAGNQSGGSVTGYGFSGANGKLANKYKNAKGKTNEEKFINTVDEYIIGNNTQGKDVYGQDLSKIKGKPDTSILTDLNIDKATFDALPGDVKKELVDWKMNSGRNTADIVVIASGGAWDGDKGARENLPGEALGKVDYKKIDGKKLIEARRAMYKGTLNLIKEKYGEDSDKYKKAKAQYENSQQYR